MICGLSLKTPLTNSVAALPFSGSALSFGRYVCHASASLQPQPNADVHRKPGSTSTSKRSASTTLVTLALYSYVGRIP
jgi:hypothetical protein